MLTYPRPLSIFTPDWAAAKATTAVLEILIQERLGYLLLTSGSAGATTLDAMHALGGCSVNETSHDLSCEDEATNDHVSLGWTESYQLSWDLLHREYPDIAPRNLGNIGYVGTRSIYVPSSLQQEAYQAEGLPLHVYLSYNSSVHNPARYFDQVNVSNESLTSRLKPCNETRLMSRSLMTAYFQATGDSEGVDTLDGVVTGRCFEDFYWYAPACRGLSTATTCLMFFTGGDGWNMEEGMHKAAAWNMPLVIGVAKTDQDYAALPFEVSSIFYWWVPDATFLALKPMEITFPGHDLTSWRRGDQRSAAKQISVDKYVSHDLRHLAPRVVQLVENFQMDLSMVNSMLEEQLNTREAYSLVACRWLQSNTQTWQTWLPKASECLPRFGVYDPQSGFLADPNGDSETNDLECRACETGSYSLRSRDKNGSTFICETCPPGTAQELPGALSSDLCPKGNFQDLHGSSSCKRCSIGSYQDAKGQSACKDCPSGTTSIGLASQSISECGCNEGTINVGRQPPLLKDDIRCVTCNEGIRCPFASSIDALRSGTSPLGDRFLPTIQRGYYSTVDQPLIIFKCRKTWQCPGRVPGQCARGRTEIACAQCPAGETWMGNSCADCNLWVTGAWVVGIVVFLMIVTCSYYVVSNHISPRASLSESVGMIALVMLNAAQCLAVIGLLDLSWPSEVEIFFSTSQLFILDLDLYGLRCIMGSTFSNYLFTVLLVPATQLWLVLCCVASSFLAKDRQWSWPKVSSTMGSLLLSAFSTTTMVALTPFMCYAHPNGSRSLLKYPEKLCDEPGALDTTGLVMLTLYVAGFWVVCVYGVCCLPSWMIQRRREMVLSFRFLIFRLRVDSWWFEVVWMLRGPSLALVILLWADQTAVQVYTLCFCFAICLLLQTFTWPWKVPIMNSFDALVSLCLLSLVVVSPSARQDGEEASTVVMALFATVISVLVLLVIFVIVHRGALHEQNVFFNLGPVEFPHELRAKMQLFTGELQKVRNSKIERVLGQMSVHDLRLISSSLDLLVAEIIPEPEQPSDVTGATGSPTAGAAHGRRISIQILNRSQTMSFASVPEEPVPEEQVEEVTLAPLHSAPAEGLSAGHEPVVEKPATDRENEDVASNSTVGKSRNIVSIKW